MATILLADDDAAVRDLVRRALAQDSHTVHATQDGAEALEHFSAHAGAIDVLVTDVNMPQLNGLDLVRQAVALRPGLRVVLMSGFAEQLDSAKALGAARLAVILKPFTLDQIRQAVRQLLA